MQYKEMNNRKVDIHTYVPVLKELIEQGRDVCITITGNSMSPFLVHERDQILIVKPEGMLKKGDMAFYQRKNGEYVMHRVCKTNQKNLYWFVGDAQTFVEGPIVQDQIFGTVKAVKRKGRWIYPGDICWEFFRTIWLWLIPVRPVLGRIYRKWIAYAGIIR